MIQGSVNAAHEAVVRLAVRGPVGGTRQIDAVIDTGFWTWLLGPLWLCLSCLQNVMFRFEVGGLEQ